MSEEEEKLTTGPVPVPLKPTTWGLPLALSVRVRLPERLPVAVGVNVTLITRLLLAATGALVPQVVPLAATAKSPVTAMLVKVKGAVPVLVTVAAWGVLVRSMFCGLNVRLAEERLTEGVPPPSEIFATNAVGSVVTGVALLVAWNGLTVGKSVE